jgi:FkbM family methyltransferase
MYVDVADMLGCLYWERQLYEPATTAFMDRHLKEGDVFADIGANHGYFSLIAAGRVGRGGRVASFEANPRLRRILQRSIDRNRWQGRATVADCALSDAEQDITLYLSNNPELSGISSMFPWEGHLTAGNLDKSRSITVTARRFDTWAAQSGLTRLDVVKIDVEGAELLVLKGMTETLTSLKPRHIVCETGLDGPVSQRLALFGYRASPLELHDHGSGWGNILYTR